jgi:hypothetical protein
MWVLVPIRWPSLAKTYAHQYRCTRINMRIYTHGYLYINKCVHIDAISLNYLRLIRPGQGVTA